MLVVIKDQQYPVLMSIVKPNTKTLYQVLKCLVTLLFRQGVHHCYSADLHLLIRHIVE